MRHQTTKQKEAIKLYGKVNSILDIKVRRIFFLFIKKILIEEQRYNLNLNINKIFVPVFLGAENFYDIDNDYIVIKFIENFKDGFMHELLHASSKGETIEGIKICGFCNIIGRRETGLDEYSTQYINSILFQNEIGYFNHNDYNIMDKLVKTVGLKSFLNCYFNADLKGLIQEISAYISEEQIEELINLIDKHYLLQTNMRKGKIDSEEYYLLLGYEIEIDRYLTIMETIKKERPNKVKTLTPA